MVLRVGASRPVRLTIPPYVAHSVLNKGSERAGFINMPTRVYDPSDPDKYRLEGGIEELIRK
jgi:dTDP-4-dehydrorhamnose 3,5-epimerase-like enzyme